MQHPETERWTKVPTDNRSADKDELAELRDRLGALETEVQRLRAERDGRRLPEGARALPSIVEVVETTPRRDANGALDAHAVSGGASVADGVSRRRLFGLLGGAAAAGAGLAVASSALGADPAGATAVTAGAADGDALQIGGSNTCTSVSSLSATNATSTFAVSNTGNGAGVVGTAIGQDAVRGTSTNSAGVAGASTNSSGVFAFSTNQNSVFVAAPTANTAGAHLRLEPTAAGAGPPTAGAHLLGQFWVDTPGKLWQCVVAGTPGTWVNLSSPFVPVNPPARVVDTRSTGGPIGTGETRAVTVAGLLGIPSGVSAVLTNLTATGANAAGFLAMVAHGAANPTTSSLNLIPNQDLANNATSAVAANEVDVHCGGPVTSVNFIVDVLGYYP